MSQKEILEQTDKLLFKLSPRIVKENCAVKLLKKKYKKMPLKVVVRLDCQQVVHHVLIFDMKFHV